MTDPKPFKTKKITENKNRVAPLEPKQDRVAAEREGLKRLKVGTVQLVDFNPDMMARICLKIIDGDTLTNACRPGNPDGFVSAPTVWRWMMLYPEAARSMAAAREASGYALEDEALDYMRKVVEGEGFNAQQVRAVDVALNQLRWSAARRNPRVYSEKTAVKMVVPIQINTGLQLDPSQPAVDPSKHEASVYTINAEVEVTTEPKEVSAIDAMVGEEGTGPLHKPSNPRGAVTSTRFRKRLK